MPEIPNRNQLAAEIKKLKDAGLTDKQVASQLETTVHRIQYIRYWYGIGGRYGKYKVSLQDEPTLWTEGKAKSESKPK